MNMHIANGRELDAIAREWGLECGDTETDAELRARIYRESTFSIGDAVILIRTQNVTHGVFPGDELPAGCVGYVERLAAHPSTPLLAVNFGAIGTFWCETDKLRHGDAEAIGRMVGPRPVKPNNQDSRMILEGAAIALYLTEQNYDPKTGIKIGWAQLTSNARHYFRQRVISLPVDDYEIEAGRRS